VKMKIFYILAVFLTFTLLFAGCTTTQNAPTVKSPPKYQTGDIVSNNSQNTFGLYIDSYDQQSDNYTYHLEFHSANEWRAVIPIQIKEDKRVNIEEALPYKVITPIPTPTPINWNYLPSTPYDDLFRYNERYIGTLTKFMGQVKQVEHLNGDNYILRIATKKTDYSNDYYENVIWVNYKGDRFLEGDTVYVWGKVIGLKEYTAVLGNTITVPEVDALRMELVAKVGTTPVYK
jgi:hypothetical protein